MRLGRSSVCQLQSKVWHIPQQRGVRGCLERRQVSAEGHDLHSLLYNFLDEWLFQFNGEMFVCRRLAITSFDRDNWKITATAASIFIASIASIMTAATVIVAKTMTKESSTKTLQMPGKASMRCHDH